MVSKILQYLKCEWHNFIILFSLFIVELVMVILVVQPGKDLSKLFNWLIGINLTIAFFSVNLTFFGHQLSKYKTIYKGIAPRQWFNIVLVLLLEYASKNGHKLS
jgi:hypothetical protein